MTPPTPPRGIFISIEGGDGAGKSTQLKLLEKRLWAEQDRTVYLTREPGGTPVGNKIREIVLGNEMSTAAQTLLFQAARAENARLTIHPALERGEIVLADRYIHSTLAMQGHAGGVPFDVIKLIHMWSTQSLLPDLTIYLDIKPEVALARQTEVNIFELRGIDYAKEVYAGFKRAKRLGCPWIAVDANGTPDEVHERVWEAVAPTLRRFSTTTVQ